MTGWTRRGFGAGAIGLLGAGRARGQTKARIVVIGGGVGGATAAKYLAGDAAFEVTLVEPKDRYTTCFGSNLYLAGLRPFESLTHGYERLVEQYGIEMIRERAVAIDAAASTVRLASGASLRYDRLVAAPGISFKFDAIAGYDEAASQVIPHAWNAGPQTRLLRAQLEAMKDGGVFVITAPKSPFRCPPGPYERASLAAYYFRRFKPRSKIVILDEKDSFFEQDLFQEAWERHYPGMIEWLPGQFTGGVRSVDVKQRRIHTESDVFEADVANIIPPQVAGALMRDSGLTDASGWCPVDPATFESKLHPGIHIIGDAADAGDMPKSAFSANSQAKFCAFAIRAALAGTAAPTPHLFNTCYTYLAADDAVSDAISFKPMAGTIKLEAISFSAVADGAARRRRTAREADDWYDAFTRDLF